jgi:hypothetical protein
MKKLLFFVIGVVIAVALFNLACRRQPAPDPALNPPAQVKSGPVVKGATFNSVFPESAEGYTRTFTQEKTGFVLAELAQGGKKVATLALSDTNNNPDTLAKFKAATGRLAGYPMITEGSQGTAILVADRFQVKVRSTAPTFSAQDRASWIQKFDLKGIEGLK